MSREHKLNLLGLLLIVLLLVSMYIILPRDAQAVEKIGIQETIKLDYSNLHRIYDPTIKSTCIVIESEDWGDIWCQEKKR